MSLMYRRWYETPGEPLNWSSNPALFSAWRGARAASIVRSSQRAMPPPLHLLVVDDDDSAHHLCAYLAGHGFNAHAARDGAGLRAALARWPITLVVMDLRRPGEDGLALTQALRHRRPGQPESGRLPIILLGERAQAMDRVVGLEMGADDFLSKPFEPRELVARIHTVLRRCVSTATGSPTGAAVNLAAVAELVRFEGWALDRQERRLTSPHGVPVALSDAEFRLLSIFLKSPRRVCSRDLLVAQARGRAPADLGRSIDLLVSRLRQKLDDDPREPRLIKTVRGAGYLFDALPTTLPAALSV
jgi:two-component system, OmpR family, response regulator